MHETRPRVCPACGSSRVADVISMSDDAKRPGDAPGLVVNVDYCHLVGPAWKCLDCRVVMRKGRSYGADEARGVDRSPAPFRCLSTRIWEPYVPPSPAVAPPALRMPSPFIPNDELPLFAHGPGSGTSAELERDMWIRPNRDLASLDDLLRYASTVDGEAYARVVLGCDLADMTDELYRRSTFPRMATFVDLRLWLFLDYLTWRGTIGRGDSIGERHENGTVAWEHSEDDAVLRLLGPLEALHQATCEAWEREGPARWGGHPAPPLSQRKQRTAGAGDGWESFPPLPPSFVSQSGLPGEEAVPPGYSLWRRTTVIEVDKSQRPPGSGSEGVDAHIWVTQSDAPALWQVLKSLLQPGDELYEFSTDQASWDELAGRAGIHVVRDGEIVATIITILN